MDPELTQSFIEEAESYLPTIRGGILLCLQNGDAWDELEIAVRQAHTIKGAALMVGFDEIGETAKRLEKSLRELFENKKPLTEEVSRRLLDNVAQVESLMMKAQLDNEEFSLDFDDFVEASFDNLRIDQLTKSGEIEPVISEDSFADAWGEEFEIDDEMLEVFALEAEDLLKNINTNLEILAKQPFDREALMEIRRSAHTFKGSAGIVGLKKPSQLAHRVEDLLDYLAENKIESNTRIFEILIASTDCLSAMTAGEDSEQLNEKITRIYSDFDSIINSLKGIAPKIPQKKKKEKQEKIVIAPPAFNTPKDDSPKIEEQKQVQQPKSIVRVSLERLDDLVKIVSDLVISRSIFEQRIGELDRQIEELNHSTKRLQRSTSKLETDFEADTLNISKSKYQASNPSFQTAGFRYNQDSSTEFDALEFDRYTEFNQTTRELIETTNDTSAINSSLDILRGNLETLFSGQSRLIEEMQDKLLRIRMVKFDSLSSRLHRTVRVTCQEENKQADLVIEGEHLEIDTQILDSLIEPLLHILRNAVAHGIELPDTRRLLGKAEKGAIKLRVASEGTHVLLTISDDGRGISASNLREKAVKGGFISDQQAQLLSEEETFELVFLQGLTTAEKLSQVSGRGIGLNAVKTAVERQQGTISIFSEPQKGTIFTLRLPMALAVTNALLVKVNEQKFAFSLKVVSQITEVSAETFQKAKIDNLLQFGSIKYKISHLNELLGVHKLSNNNNENVTLLLLDTPENPCALMVDKIIKPEELVVKPLGAPLQNMAEMLGAAILGDGSVVPVLDLLYLVKRKVFNFRTKSQSSNDLTGGTHFKQLKKEVKVMIVDDSPSVRHLTSKVVKNAGFNSIIAKDGLEALDTLKAAGELPDIILTDVEMPRMDGYELLASLKKQESLQNIPVIMITSRAGEKHRRKAFELGVSEYLIKPYDDAKLVETIKLLSAG